MMRQRLDCRTALRLAPVLAAVLAFAWIAPADQSAKPAPVGSFEQAAKPFIGKYCVNCHGGKKPAGDLSLAKADAGSVQDDRPSWEAVRERLNQGEMPPKKKLQPTMDEKKAFLAWLDGALSASACTAPADPGRVTLRRLNKVEYNNTVRDLLGVDIQPADDFPADDIGYGFDNIGDVLAVSPLLFEKYLAAAERIVEKAFEDDLAPLPPTAIYPGRELKASAKAEGDFDWVSMSKHLNFKAVARSFTDGELFVEHRFNGDGEYRFSYAAFGAQTDKEQVRVALLLDGKVMNETDLKPFAVRGRPGGRNFKLSVKAGNHRVAIKILNPKSNPEESDSQKRKRAVVFDNVSIRGPMPAVERIPSASYKRIMFVQPGKSLSEKECARRICERLARRAFRRPVTDAEVDRLTRLVEMARAHGDSFDKGIQLAVQAVLVSPHFLFKIERDRKLLDKPYPIGEHELATRLSYFLWSSMPDDELFRLADRGVLRKYLDAQVRRMLKDPKADALGENFAGQWLQVRNVKSIMIDPALFPQFDDELRAAFAKETTLFFEAIVKEDRSILDFLDGDFSYVNGRLARYYGIPGVSGPEFRRVSLKGTPRGGILTQGSVLTVTSNATRTSPVKRGKYILETLFNAPPPPPPPDVPEFKETADAIKSGSLRKRMEQHRANPDCAVCHDKMDALGFAFENFDAVGGWRTKDGAFPIDPAGTLPDGRSFKDPAELRAILRSEPDKFRRCLAEKLLTYALGRGVEPADHCSVDQICKTTAERGDTFSELVLAVVNSDPFQMRSPHTATRSGPAKKGAESQK
jgi:mono/diheme cytochrome c family protein